MDNNSEITYFARTDYRNKQVPFGIKGEDRTRHMYVIGKTGMGKSTLLENLAIQDIQNGNGLAFIDPHGKSAELLLDYVPEHRIEDVLYFAPFDMEYPVAFNVMEDIGPDKRHLVVNGLMSTFEKIWVDAWSARMAYILNNTLLALLEYPDSTLLGINRMLSDKEYRKLVIQHVQDPSVRSFWLDEFAKYTDRYAQEATPAIQNKVGQFTSNPLIRNIIGQQNSSFDLREIMDKKKILIVNLSKGKVGEGNANLLGSMLVTKIYLAAMSRADSSPQELRKLPSFNLYVDEFQSFANKSFSDILSEARKYKLNLTIAHQYIEQMEEEVRAAVFGNVGTLVTFRVGATDAEYLEKEFAPIFTAEDLVNLGIYQVYLKLMIDGVSSSPFSGVTLPPIRLPSLSWKEEILKASRNKFANPRSEVEGKIIKWHEMVSNSGVSNQRRDDERGHFQSNGSGQERSVGSTQHGGSSHLNNQSSNNNHSNSGQNQNTINEPKIQDRHQPFAKAFSEIKIIDSMDRQPTEQPIPNNQSGYTEGRDNSKKYNSDNPQLTNKPKFDVKTKLRDAHDGKDGTLRDLLGQILSKESKEESHNNQNQNNGASHTNQQKQNTDSVNQEIDPETLKKILTDERFNHQK